MGEKTLPRARSAAQGAMSQKTLRRNSLPRQRRNGAMAVEFAIVAPVMFLLLFGLFEFTRMVWIQQAVANAAREACREAVLVTTTNKNDVDVAARTHLQGTIANPSDVNRVRVTVSPENIGGLTSHEQIMTTVAVSYSDVSLFPPWFLGNAEIRSTATMERE
jgi:Flp pilus assembly protein TadG